MPDCDPSNLPWRMASRAAAFALLSSCLVAANGSAQSSGAGPGGSTPDWASRPYAVQVRVATDGAPVWTSHRLQEIVRHLQLSAGRTFGGAWQLEVISAAEPQPAASDGKKLIKLSLTAPRGQAAYHAVAVSEEPAAGWMPPVVEETTPALADVPAAAWRVVAAAFLPEAMVVGQRDGRVRLQGRAAELTRDERFAACRPGAVLRLAAAGSTSSPPQDGVYFVVERVEGSQALCRIVGRQSQLTLQPGKSLALQVAAADLSPTTLILRHAERNTPLPGLRVAAIPLAGEPQFLGETDARGRLVLSALKQPLAVIAIYVGETPVERFPLVNGWPRTLELSLQLTSAQLAADASLAAFRDRLTALAIRRDIALARARARAAAGKLPEAESLLQQLRDALAAEARPLQAALENAKRNAAGNPALAAAWDELAANFAQEIAPARIDQVATAIRPPPPMPEKPTMPAVPPGWERFQSAAGGFQVLLSAKPQEGKFNTAVGAATVSLNYVTATGGQGRPILIVAWYEAAAAPSLADVIQLFSIAYQAQAQAPKEITLGMHKGQELRGELQAGGKFVTRIFVVGKRAYLAIVTSAGEPDASPDTKQFLDSFEFTAP